MSSPNANSQLQIGLIGAGMVGQLHARAMQQVPGLKIVALADLRPELRRLVAAEHRISRVYETHHELLCDPSIDAVAVVVRRAATSAVVRDCLMAGKHVYSEKPIAMTAATAAELAQLAHERELFYTIGYQKRYDPGLERCSEMLARLRETGELGRLMLVRGWEHTGRDREPDSNLIMTDETRPTGLALDAESPAWLPARYAASYDRFVNTFCPDINALRSFFPEAPRVRAAALEVLGGQAIMLQYPNVCATLVFTLSELADWSVRSEWDEGFEFYFEAGRLAITFAPPLYRTGAARVTVKRGSEPADIICDGMSAVSQLTFQARAFFSDFANARPSRTSADRCVGDMLLIEDIWRTGVGLDQPGSMQTSVSAAAAEIH